MDLREFNPSARRRRNYFESRGFDAPPLNQIERYNQAVNFIQRETPDYEASISLYDEIEDYDFADFLYLIGYNYSREDSSLFDDVQAVEYYWRSLHFSQLDYARLNAANGLLNSYFRLYNIELKDYGDLYKLPRIVHAIQVIIDLGQEPQVFKRDNHVMARHLMSHFYGAGLGVSRDLKKSQDLNWSYRQQYQNPVTSGIYYSVDLILSMKTAIGLGGNQSSILALDLLQGIDEKYRGKLTEEINAYIKKRENPSYHDAAQKLMDAFGQNPNPFSLTKIIRDASLADLEAITDTLYILKNVANFENWPDCDDLANIYLTAFSTFKPHPAQNRSDAPDMSVYSNTYKYGPFYNQLDQHNIPIWGDFSATFRGSDHARCDKRIPSGWRSFSGLTTDQNGNINFHFKRSYLKPAMIFQEDLDVIMALVYGADEPVYPSLGLYHTGSGAHPYPGMQIKGFDPDWLTVTDLGKTFYVCDYLSGLLTFRLDWSIKNFPVSEGKSKRLENMAYGLKQIIADIKGDKKPDHPNGKDGYSEILNNNPEFVSFSGPDTVNGNHALWINHVVMRIQGGFVDAENMRKTRSQEKPSTTKWEFTNDPAYQHTNITRTLTDHYDVIAELMPVYERLRQLMGMINATQSLRVEKNFIPNASVQQKAKKDLACFIEKHRRMGMQTEYVRAPLHQNIPFRFGG